MTRAGHGPNAPDKDAPTTGRDDVSTGRDDVSTGRNDVSTGGDFDRERDDRRNSVTEGSLETEADGGLNTDHLPGDVSVGPLSPPTIVSAGHINWDVTMHVKGLPEPDGETRIERLEQSGGGSAANVAVGFVDLGGRAAVYGSVGGDESGALALRGLATEGVDPGQVLIDGDAPTSVKYVIVDSTGELMMLANDGANEAFSAAELDHETLVAADHLHLTSQQPETAAALATAAGETGATRSFDPGRRVGDRAYDAAIRASDLLFLNEREAVALADATDIDPWEPTKHVVVLKLGSEGATVRTPAGDVSHPGFEIDPVDRTGAGDAFAAGFLATALRDDATTEDGAFSDDPRDFQVPLLVGNACGALAAQAVTARVDLSWDRIRTTMGTDPEADLLIEIRV